MIICQMHTIGSVLLSSRCMTNYTKACSFLYHVHADFTESMRQFQCVPTTYDIENRENNLSSIMSIVSASFKYPKLKIPVALLQSVLYLHDSYIAKFEFMNYLLANLIVTRLLHRYLGLIVGLSIFNVKMASSSYSMRITKTQTSIFFRKL